MTFSIKFGSIEEAETYLHGTTLPDFPIIRSSWLNKIKIKMTPTFVCLFYQVMLTIRGRLITPFVLGSMSVGLNILIRHSFMDL